GFLAQRRQEKVAGTFQKGNVADPVFMYLHDRKKEYLREMAARFALGFTTERPFAERLVWFWSNHFTVSVTNGGTLPFAGAFEREAIRPHTMGKFEDMVLAV